MDIEYFSYICKSIDFVMQYPISEKVSKILHEADLISTQEKQNLFWLLLEKFGQERIFSYQYLEITDYPSYFLSFPIKQTLAPKRILGTWKDKITYIADDFNAPLDELKDYM